MVRRFRWSRGFTLIELLVVISIIALLVGLLLPSLAGARAVAISARCLANEHNLGIANAQYITDYDYLPGYNPDQYGSGQKLTRYLDPGEPNGPYDSTVVGLWADLADCGGSPAARIAGDPAETIPFGLGCLGAYLSSDGSYFNANGNVFFCPGNPMGDATTIAWGGEPWNVQTTFQATGSFYANTYHTKWGGYYGGFANYGVASTYLNWVAASKPTNPGPQVTNPNNPATNQALNSDNSCTATYTYRACNWAIDHSLPLTSPNWATNTTASTSTIVRPDSPYCQGAIALTDFDQTGLGSILGGGAKQNLNMSPHTGHWVNNLWMDGHAGTMHTGGFTAGSGATFSVSSGVLPIGNVNWYANQYPTMTLAAYNSNPFSYQNSATDFWWEIADTVSP